MITGECYFYGTFLRFVPVPDHHSQVRQGNVIETIELYAFSFGNGLAHLNLIGLWMKKTTNKIRNNIRMMNCVTYVSTIRQISIYFSRHWFPMYGHCTQFHIFYKQISVQRQLLTISSSQKKLSQYKLNASHSLAGFGSYSIVHRTLHTLW